MGKLYFIFAHDLKLKEDKTPWGLDLDLDLGLTISILTDMIKQKLGFFIQYFDNIFSVTHHLWTMFSECNSIF